MNYTMKFVLEVESKDIYMFDDVNEALKAYDKWRVQTKELKLTQLITTENDMTKLAEIPYSEK